MEEELSENELEGRMYAMLHYVDETQTNVGLDQKGIKIVDNVQHSGLRRYWHNNNEQKTPYQKINTPKEPVKAPESKNVVDISQHKKEEQEKERLSSSPDLSIFQQPVPNNIKKTVEILENEDLHRVFELESSDDDEVIEVALPPKPTITIESSDEDTVAISISTPEKKTIEKNHENKTSNREVTASPVPSVVSSVSDEFIRGDCIALNISSKHADNQSFDFSLHGADLLGQTPTRKKKKKRNKDTSTPNTTPVTSTPISVDECFATPKSKAKNKRQRTKSYSVTEKSVPNPDVYDSDSNQSTNEGNKYPNPFAISDKSLPNTEVCESDQLIQSEVDKDASKVVSVNKEAENTSSSTESSITTTPKTTKKDTDITNTKNNTLNESVIDLTTPDANNVTINENIVMGNVTGFTVVEDSIDENTQIQDLSMCGSTKIPAILTEDLDFDNLKGNNKVCKRRRYSLTTLRAEMEKFYNESWGGEDFNHREIQKNMSRDKNLWVIDPKDRMSSLTRRKTTCNYCNRVGHRDEMCKFKPPVCYMCGSTGHFEPRCPKKICVNCGSPNRMYSTMCRNCCNWDRMRCAECGQSGHPASHCPDLWRRYHNTINLNMPLEENHQSKKHYQIYCSGCTRRGHFVHTCRNYLPFSGLPINSPFVSVYRPVYSPIFNNDSPQNNPNQGNKQYMRNVPQDPNLSSESTPQNDQLKRQSKSPVNHETHLNKRKNFGLPDDTEIRQRTKSPINNNNSLQKKDTQNKEQPAITNKNTAEPNKIAKIAPAEKNQATDEAPDFIPVTSSENHDNKGQIIQDNEVSDTSDVVTSARIYIPKEIVEKLKTEEGDTWMKEALKKNDVTLESDNISFYVSIKGTVGNQEAFQAELRDWIATKQNKERAVSQCEADVTQESITDQSVMVNNIPKNRNTALRQLNQAFETLKADFGDPKALYRELVYLQDQHEQLLKVKAISPQRLSNSRNNINGMLRKLNMVLIGQAGLAGGFRHLRELHLLQEKLTNYRQKIIPLTMREEIGQHFHCIFTATPRDDYVELLNKYYYSRPTPALKNRPNNMIFKSPTATQKNKFNIQHLQQNVNTVNDDNRQSNTALTTPLIAKTKHKLIFYKRRLMGAYPRDKVLKKTKTELINKINSQIISFERKSHASKRNFKKIKKVQEQAQLFLSNLNNLN